MKKFLKVFAVILVLTLCFTACGKKEALDETTAKNLADKHSRLMVSGDFEAVMDDCDEIISKQLTADALKQAWDTVALTAGEYIGPYSSVYARQNGLATVVSTLEYENTGIVLTFVYDIDGKIAGLWLKTTVLSNDLTETDSFVENFITVGEYELTGVATLPKNTEDYPVAVLVQGSGSSDYDETIGANKPFKEIAHTLAEKGIASVRVNKRFYQKPELATADITIYDEYMDDIYAAVDYAKVNISENVFIIGHSQGAMSAPKIATDTGAKGFVMMAGTIRGLEDVIYEQNFAIIDNMDNLSEDEKLTMKRQVADEVAKIKELKEGDTDVVMGIPASYWLSLRDLNAEEILTTTELPALIMQGTADFQVSYEVDYQKMERLFGDRDNIIFEAYEGLNHLFMPQTLPGVMDVSEYERENHIPDYVLNDITDFIIDNY